HRPRGAFKVDLHLGGNDVRQRRLAEPWRATKQDVIDRIATMSRRFNQDTEIFLHLLLTDIVIQRARTQARFPEGFIRRLSRLIYQTVYHAVISLHTVSSWKISVLSLARQGL